VNGLRAFGDMASLITAAERLRALQAESVGLSETNVEWHRYELRENMQKLFTKAFGAARLEYCTSPKKHRHRFVVQINMLRVQFPVSAAGFHHSGFHHSGISRTSSIGMAKSMDASLS
jgi:hypothetical protein